MQFHIAETRRNGRVTLPWPGSVLRPRRTLGMRLQIAETRGTGRRKKKKGDAAPRPLFSLFFFPFFDPLPSAGYFRKTGAGSGSVHGFQQAGVQELGGTVSHVEATGSHRRHGIRKDNVGGL